MEEFIETPESSNVVKFAYNQSEKSLTVVFHGFPDNSVYDYYEVPERIFTEMKQAKSKGTYLADNIRNRFRYDKRRV